MTSNMSAQAGKKSKKKGKSKTTVSLNDFLGDSSSPGVIKQMDWADEADEDFRAVNSSLTYQTTSSAPKVITLPTAPRASRTVEVDQSRIPDNGPFTAFVGNLPYEVDEDILQEFFKELPIVNVRLPEENGRFKGFGYVQFGDKPSLVKALQMNEETLQKRNIRIDIADNQNKADGSSWGRSGGYTSQSGPDRTEGDWRKASAEEEEPNQPPDRRGSYRNDSYDGSYRKNYQGHDQNERGYGSRGYDRGGYDRPRYNDRGYNQSRNDDRYGGHRMDAGPARERPHLNLQPRQKPLDDDTSATTRSSSIFGSAKPVDTAARERAIEEKIQLSAGEHRAPEKKSSNIFGQAKPIDSRAREREIEEKIKAQKERAMEMNASKPQPTRTSVFGDAKPVDTSARERQIEEKLRKQEQEYSSMVVRDETETPPRRHSRRSSERSDDVAPSSPRRRSRTSSTRSNEGSIETTSPQQRSSVADRKLEYRPAPIPKENAWGRKSVDKPAQEKRDVIVEVDDVLQSSSNAWNRGPPKPNRGVREEAEGNSKEDEDVERTPEGAADEEDAIQNRTEPGDGSEHKQATSSSHRGYNTDRRPDAYRDRRGGGRYNDRNYESRRRGDGDNQQDERTSKNRRDYRLNNRNEWNEKKRDSSRDSRPECDRPDAAGQEQPSSGKPSKVRSKLPQVDKEENRVDFVSQSKFSLLEIEDSGDDDEQVE